MGCGPPERSKRALKAKGEGSVHRRHRLGTPVVVCCLCCLWFGPRSVCVGVGVWVCQMRWCRAPQFTPSAPSFGTPILFKPSPQHVSSVLIST